MKILAIGDIHGKTIWEAIVNSEIYDLVVFMGDYFDCFEKVTAAQQIANFKKIVQLKIDNPDRVIILLGNHDFHYLREIKETYGGFQEWSRLQISDAIHEVMEHLQMCFVHENIVFTHAGITKTWFKNYIADEPLIGKALEVAVNNLFKSRPNAFCFQMRGATNEYGDDIHQSPIWVRPDSLLADKMDGLSQVVGHTYDFAIKELSNIWFIDTLEWYGGEYLVIDNGVMHPKIYQSSLPKATIIKGEGYLIEFQIQP